MATGYSSSINLQLPEQPRLSYSGNEAAWQEFQMIYLAVRNLWIGVTEFINSAPGSTSTWGSIIGDITAQTDLVATFVTQSAYDAEVAALQSAIADKLSDAPSDGSYYARLNGAWAAFTPGTGGIPEAPVDGKTYGRKDAAWVEVTGGSSTGGILPVVTGEIPPVLVYLEDGSLLYSEV